MTNRKPLTTITGIVGEIQRSPDINSIIREYAD